VNSKGYPAVAYLYDVSLMHASTVPVRGINGLHANVSRRGGSFGDDRRLRVSSHTTNQCARGTSLAIDAAIAIATHGRSIPDAYARISPKNVTRITFTYDLCCLLPSRYGAAGFPAWGIPPNATLIFDVSTSSTSRTRVLQRTHGNEFSTVTSDDHHLMNGWRLIRFFRPLCVFCSTWSHACAWRD
jgi:hypothetical protein